MNLIYKLDISAIKLLTEVFLLESLSPSSNWSFINRLIVKLHDTNDARTFDDWRKIDRLPHVHSAINIVIPVQQHVRKFSKLKDAEIEYNLRYFKTKPVYKYENTQGVNYPSIMSTSKFIMNKSEFIDKYELSDEFTYEEVSSCIEKLVPSTTKYDNKLVRFLVTNIIIALYDPIQLEKMGQFDQIRKYDKNIIYYALSSLAYSAKVLESLLSIEGKTQIREQKNEYLSH
jgi:hypothetical protein